MQHKRRKSSFKVTNFGIAKDILCLVAFGLVLATVDVYSDVALSYQFYTVNTTDYHRSTATAPSSGQTVSSYCMKQGSVLEGIENKSVAIKWYIKCVFLKKQLNYDLISCVFEKTT